jgi:hypothetical protein
MEHLAAIMILIGCNGPTSCQQVPAPTVAYETVAECRRALKPAIMDAVSRAPEVYGTCTEVDPAELEQDVSIYWDLSKDGRITVQVVNADEEMAEKGRMLASR